MIPDGPTFTDYVKKISASPISRRPCPWCKSDGKSLDVVNTTKNGTWAYCRVCGASGPAVYSKDRSVLEKLAWAAWEAVGTFVPEKKETK